MTETTASSDRTNALNRARALCAERGVRMTDLRQKVFETLLDAATPVKAYDLLPILGSPETPAKPATAYRTLDFLQDVGLVHKVNGLNAYVACVHGGGHHPTELFICESCGVTRERRGSLIDASTPPQGFVVRRSVMEHYGHCADCAATA